MMNNQRLDRLNFNLKINDVEFTIERININVEQFTTYQYQHFMPTRKTISMVGYTSNQNYMKIGNWFENSLSNQNSYKFDYCKNGLNLYGVFPIEYDFTPDRIRVQFSVEHFEGDIELFKLAQLRKAKLLKIAQCQK